MQKTILSRRKLANNTIHTLIRVLIASIIIAKSAMPVNAYCAPPKPQPYKQKTSGQQANNPQAPADSNQAGAEYSWDKLIGKGIKINILLKEPQGYMVSGTLVKATETEYILNGTIGVLPESRDYLDIKGSIGMVPKNNVAFIIIVPDKTQP